MRIASFVPAAALLLAACSTDSEPRLVTPSSTPAALAATIAIASGNEQEGKAGERLPQPLVIHVTDASGSGIRDAAVSVDTSPYRITATSVPEGGAPFDSGTLSGSSRFRFVPTVAGTWQYRDTISGLAATLRAK
jgi:hypothetical protein